MGIDMKTIIATTCAMGMLTGMAFASDLPMRPVPVVKPPAFSWAGFYIGVNAGLGWANSGAINITDPRVGQVNMNTVGKTGFVGGGQIGYNWQHERWVFGLETDIQYSDLKSGVSWAAYEWFGYQSSNSQYLGTVRGRVGYAFDRTLIYLTGGLAYGGLNGNWWHGSTSNQGWTLGGGIEYAFTDNWTGRIEGLYVDLNSGNHSASHTRNGVLGTYTVSGNSGSGGGIVRAAVNYKFDWR
jgi:outer membrane immunogenic protein